MNALEPALNAISTRNLRKNFGSMRAGKTTTLTMMLGLMLPTYAFEGMRAILYHQEVRIDLLLGAFA